MEIKKSDIHAALNEYSSDRKYYVYRLVDPRTFQTFYVGKGCGDRVLQHINDVKSLINTDENKNSDSYEDELSLKSKLIAEIIGSGKNVIPVIHRRGLTKNEAFEVEAALIDAYPSLTNIQKGHGYDRGVINLDDLCAIANAEEYEEPEEKYIIIKTSYGAIEANGNLYEATRICWKASLKNAEKYHYVFSVINGIVIEVYKVDNWFQYNSDRIAFEGEPTEDHMAKYKWKRIPIKYRIKGASNPFLYKKRLGHNKKK